MMSTSGPQLGWVGRACSANELLSFDEEQVRAADEEAQKMRHRLYKLQESAFVCRSHQ